MRTLRRGLLQPEPCLRRLGVIRFTAQAAELQLRLAITCPGRLAQQLESDATVALAVALAAQQAAKAALRFDHTLARNGGRVTLYRVTRVSIDLQDRQQANRAHDIQPGQMAIAIIQTV